MAGLVTVESFCFDFQLTDVFQGQSGVILTMNPETFKPEQYILKLLKKNFFADKIKKLFDRPFYMSAVCLIFLIFNLLIDGTLLQIFYLGRDLRIIKNRALQIQEKNLAIQQKIHAFSDPDFIEKEARERLDFAEEGDLIFIFPEDI